MYVCVGGGGGGGGGNGVCVCWGGGGGGVTGSSQISMCSYLLPKCSSFSFSITSLTKAGWHSGKLSFDIASRTGAIHTQDTTVKEAAAIYVNNSHFCWYRQVPPGGRS